MWMWILGLYTAGCIGMFLVRPKDANWELIVFGVIGWPVFACLEIYSRIRG